MSSLLRKLTSRSQVAILILVAVAVTAGFTTARSFASHASSSPTDDKRALLNRYLTPRPGQALPAQKPAHPQLRACPPVEQPHGAFQIIDPSKYGYPVAVPGSMYQVSTLWKAARNDRLVLVYAGDLTEDPTQGMIIVMTMNQCEMVGSTEEYRTPSRVGSLTLTDVNGDKVTFSYPGGTGTFNMATGQFTMN